ncbi:MAG: hypothetical protein ACE148_03530 [Vicinamibacterales bacterium]
MTKRLGTGLLAAVIASAGAGVAPVVSTPQTAPGTVLLGSVRLPRAVLADGKPLQAGSYRLRLTEDVAKPDVIGAQQQLERWVEFLQGNDVKGREVASVVPQGQISEVADSRIPAAGTVRVDLLKGGDYYRVWIHRGDSHYLIHLRPAE